MGLGSVENVTLDSSVMAPTTLFPRLGRRQRRHTTQCKPRHRNQEFQGGSFAKVRCPFLRYVRLSDRRQLLHLEARQGLQLDGTTAPFPCARQLHLCLLAEPGGALVWDHQPMGHPKLQLLQR